MKPIYIVLIAVAALVIGFLIGRAASKNKSAMTTTTTTTVPNVTVPATAVNNTPNTDT